MKKLRRNTDGIHNRGTLLTPPPSEPDPPFYLPTEGEMLRAQRLRTMANTFRNAANDIATPAPQRSELLKRRARMMDLKAALILLGESSGEDDE